MYGALYSSDPLPAPAVAVAILEEIGREFTPRVERTTTGVVLLDLRGLGRVWPSPEELGTALLEAASRRGLSARVALAHSRVAASLLARAGPGLTVAPPGAATSLLAPLSVDLLDLSPERRELLQRWGLRTLGDLARLPAGGLAERLGPEGPWLRRQALGEDDTPLVPTLAPESFECTLDLDWPIDGLEPLAFLLTRVLEPLCQSLAARGRRAAAVRLDLVRVDGARHMRTLRPALPSGDPRTWRTLLLLDLESHPPGDAVQGLRVRADPTPARAVQFSLLDPAQPSPEQLAETLARLGAWTEAGRAGSPTLLDSHRPGAFVVEAFAPGRPEPTAAEAPPRLALRAFRPPLPAQVTLREGVPLFVAASGLRGSVLESAGPWRVSGDWWDVAWSRETWDVAIGSAGLYRIFRDRLRQAWFVEGELD
jgi:protein ImuB